MSLNVHLLYGDDGKLCACKPESPALFPPRTLVCREDSRQKIVRRVQKKVEKDSSRGLHVPMAESWGNRRQGIIIAVLQSILKR
jgi:hypothetical protein